MAETAGAYIKATTQKHAEIARNCYEGDRRGIVPADAERFDPSDCFAGSFVMAVFTIIVLAYYITTNIFVLFAMGVLAICFIFFVLMYANAQPVYIHFFPHVLVITDRNGYMLGYHSVSKIQWNITRVTSEYLLLKIQYLSDTNKLDVRYWTESNVKYSDLYYYLTGNTM